MNIPAEFRSESHYHWGSASKRYRRARQWLVIVGFLLLVANGLLLRYASNALAPSPLVGGLTCGSLLASGTLLVSVWRRQMWARYILICLLWVCLVTFCVPLLRDLGQGGSIFGKPPQFIMAGLIFYAAANVILIRSRSIRTLVSPASSRSLRRV